MEMEMEQFMIDTDGVLWVLIEGATWYACTGLPCKEGEEQKVLDSIPDGTILPYYPK